VWKGEKRHAAKARTGCWTEGGLSSWKGLSTLGEFGLDAKRKGRKKPKKVMKEGNSCRGFEKLEGSASLLRREYSFKEGRCKSQRGSPHQKVVKLSSLTD